MTGLSAASWAHDMELLKKLNQFHIEEKWDITSITGYSSKKSDSVCVWFKRRRI